MFKINMLYKYYCESLIRKHQKLEHIGTDSDLKNVHEIILQKSLKIYINTSN